jgi:hypothetical protein
VRLKQFVPYITPALYFTGKSKAVVRDYYKSGVGFSHKSVCEEASFKAYYIIELLSREKITIKDVI